MAPAASASGESKLSSRGRELLNEARARGDATVTVLIASTEGQNQRVADAIAALGGTVRLRTNSISYIRAVVPATEVESLARNASIDVLDLDEIIPWEEVQPDGAINPTPQTPPGPSTPRDNPYMPIADTGAAQFTAANPAWDGRGIVVGVVDSGVTLDHPALQTTTTGERKIIDWVNYNDPLLGSDPSWVNMATQVSGSSFSHAGVTYTAPTAGDYRIGLFNERLALGEVGGDVNRDGNLSGSSGMFAVLWDMASNNVWVDTNQDASFADETAMTDYRVRYDIGVFGRNNATTAVSEEMKFVIQTDRENGFVNIGIPDSAHGSHVAGIVAANGMFGGAMSGAAPGAQIISVRACLFGGGCTAHALIEGMTWVIETARVDVVNMSIGGLPALNDGLNTRSVLYNRLITQYGVQMFISAGNSGPGLNSIGDPSVANRVMSVGSYISKATWQANYGSDSSFDDNLHSFTSRGPSEAGDFKPQIVAPGSAISTVPMWQTGGPVGGTYELPPGYAMFNGTSMASPQAAGAAALLLSAAQQSGVVARPPMLRQAMISSARFLDPDRYQAVDQGNGLINVGAAWDLLKQDIMPVTIRSFVPVNSVLSPLIGLSSPRPLPDRLPPSTGVGIYDREGVQAGTPYSRTYTFIRTDGAPGAITYNLSWVGNNGVFSAPRSITLPRNRAVTFNVNINPTSAGLHSAILNVDDPRTTGIDYQTMNTVVAADDLTAANNYSVTKTGSVGRNQILRYFVRVPAGTPAFKVDFSGPGATSGTGQARFLRYSPWGVPIDSTSSLSCYSPVVASCSTGSPLSRVVSNPIPGVWEVTVDARRTSDVADAPFRLSMSILGATVAPASDTIATAQVGVPIARSYTLSNRFGSFSGRAAGTALGSAQRGVFSTTTGAIQEYQVVVPSGSTSLRATIGNPSDAGADLDLFVYNCTSGACVLAGQGTGSTSEETVTIANPAAGNWLIRVDGYAVPSGNTTYNYLDVVANPAFGSISLTDANALREAGASWIVAAIVTANTAPASGRVLLGNVQVRTDSNVLIGSNEVIIESVTP
jgi:subtilisin family serine protease